MEESFGTAWLKGFQRKIRTANSLAVELWLIRDGLILARSIGSDDIFVESNAQEAIHLIVEDAFEENELTPIICDCKNTFTEIQEV